MCTPCCPMYTSKRVGFSNPTYDSAACVSKPWAPIDPKPLARGGVWGLLVPKGLRRKRRCHVLGLKTALFCSCEWRTGCADLLELLLGFRQHSGMKKESSKISVSIRNCLRRRCMSDAQPRKPTSFIFNYPPRPAMSKPLAPTLRTLFIVYRFNSKRFKYVVVEHQHLHPVNNIKRVHHQIINLCS